MGFGKCHLFFSCGIMKFYLFLLFLLLLFDSPQGSTISLKRSVRALNTTLQTNFNGTYERRNPCTNAEIETTSYIASHEFHHHTKEDNWSDYTHKCSSIISSFLKALGNLVRFNHKENGIFNFHINTSISQKQDGHCEPGKRTICNSLPTITIEATDCEISPKTPCGNLAVDGSSDSLSETGNEGTDEQESSAYIEDITPEMAPKEAYVNEDLLLQTPQCQAKIPSIPLKGATAAQAEKLPEADDVWVPDDILLPTDEKPVPLGAQFSRTSTLSGNIRTKDFSRAVNGPLEDTQTNFFEASEPENYILPEEEDPEKPEADAPESFNESSPDEPYYLTRPSGFEITPSINPYEDQFSKEDILINKQQQQQQPIGYSKQLFNDNMDEEVLLSDQGPADSFTSDQNPPFNPQDQPKNTYDIDPIPIQQSSQEINSMKRNEAIYADQFETLSQPQQNEEAFDDFPDRNIPPSKTDLYPPQEVKFEETPSSQMTNPEAPQIPNFVPSARQSLDYVGQTPTLEFAMSYPVPLKQTPLTENSQKNVDSFTKYDGREGKKLESQNVDYPNELSKAKSSFTNSDIVPAGFTFSPEREIAISDKLFTYNVKNPQGVTPSWTPQEQFPNKNTGVAPLEPPFSSSETISQNSDENITTDPVADSEFLVPSDQYQPTARPESQSLLKYDDEYDNDRERESEFPQSKSEFLSNKPFLPSSSSSTFPPIERTSSFEYPPSISSNQNLPGPQLSDENPSNYPSGSSSLQKQTQPEPESFRTLQPPPEEYLPSDEESIEDPDEILPTFNSYQDQPNFSEIKTASPFPDQTLSAPILDASAANLKETTETFSDDYEDPLYPNAETNPSFTTPIQYESTPKPFFANDQAKHEKVSQPTDEDLQLPPFDSDAQMSERIPEPTGFESQSRPFFDSSSNRFPIEPLQSESFSEPYLNDRAETSQQPEPNPTVPFAEDLFQEDQTLMPYERGNLPSGQAFKTPLPRDSNAVEISEQVPTDEYEQQDLQTDVPSDSDDRKFSPRLITTPLFENSMTKTGTEELTSLDQPLSQAPQFEEPAPATLIGDLNENNPDFSSEKDLEQSTTPVYANQNDQPLSPETSPLYIGKQYSSAEQPEIMAFPEYDNAPIDYQPNEKPVREDSENVMPNYNLGDGFVTYSPREQQSEDSFEEESAEQFSDSNPKEPLPNFFPISEQPFIQTYSDSAEDQVGPNSEILEPQSQTSDQPSDQIPPLEFKSKSNKPFNDKPPIAAYEQTPLQMSPLEVTNNQPFQAQITQLEGDAPNFNNPLEDALMTEDSSQSSVPSDDFTFDSTPLPEIETYSMNNETPDQQSPMQPELDQTNEKQSTDYPSFMEPSSQIQPPLDDYDKKMSDSIISTAPRSEFSSASQTSFEEYSDSLNPPTIPLLNPSYSNEKSETQYSQEKILDYSSDFSPEPQSQRSFDYSAETSENKAERIPQLNDFDYISPIEVEPERLGDNNGGYSPNTDYKQNIKSKYLNEPPNPNFNAPTSDINTQNEEFLEPSESVTSNPVPETEFYPDELASPLPSSAFPSYQTPANVRVQSSEWDSAPFRDVTEKQIVEKTSENFSEQSLPTTAVKYDDEITDFSQTVNPQPQRSLDLSDQPPNSEDQQFPVTPYADSSEFEPTPTSFEKGDMDFNSDPDSTNQPSLLLQPPKPPQLNTFTGPSQEAQNDFDSDLPSYIPVSPSFKGVKAETSDRPFEAADQPPINPKYSTYNNEQQPPLYNNQYESQPQIPSSPGIFGRFSPRLPFRKPQYLSDDTISDSESQELTAADDNQQSFSAEEEENVQTPPQISQPRYPNAFDASSVNFENNQPPNSLNLPNQYPNYNSRVEPPTETISNEYDNEPEPPSNPQPIAFDSKPSPEYFVNDAEQGEDSFEQNLPLGPAPVELPNSDYPEKPDLEPSPDKIIQDFSPYDEYDQIPPRQLSNEKLLEYDEEIEPDLEDEKSANVQTDQQQNPDMAEQSLEDLNDYRDTSTPDNEPPSFPSSPAHSNPLIQTLEHHLNFPMQKHLGPPSFSDPEPVSPINLFPFDPKNRGKFRGSSAVLPNSEKQDFEDIVNAPQSDSHALVSDPNTPSNKPDRSTTGRFNYMDDPTWDSNYGDRMMSSTF